ncbi:unnamed protein product, partial [Mesorhabditis spiculigera]
MLLRFSIFLIFILLLIVETDAQTCGKRKKVVPQMIKWAKEGDEDPLSLGKILMGKGREGKPLGNGNDGGNP